MSSAGSPFTFVYDNLGIGTTAWTTSNANEVRRLMVGLGNDSNRIKFPRIAMQRTTAGTAPNATNPARVVLAYYDARNPGANLGGNSIQLNYGYFYGTTYVGANSNFTGNANTNSTGGQTPATAQSVANSVTATKAKSGQYVAAGLLSTGRAVVAWYDATAQCLWFSYGSAAPGNNTTTPAQTMAQWQNNAVKIKDYVGTHVDMAVDAGDNIHLAYVDARNGGLWYSYIPSSGTGANLVPNSKATNTNDSLVSTAVQTVRVDTYLSTGTKLMINVRTQETGNYVPYITYIHNAFAETKNSVRIAWRNTSMTALGHGTNEDHTFTSNWEVMTLPAGNIPNTQEFVCNGVPTATTTWAAPSGSTLRTYDYLNNSILVGYMTDRWYEGAILKYRIWQ
jgi:hypothetical protein